MADLHLLTQREFSTAESKTIKWREIDSRIETMKLALEADDGVSFEKTRSELLKNVRPRNETQREFGREAEDPKQLAPEGTRELLNHLVDQILCKLNEPQSSRENQPLNPNRKVQT